MGATSMDVSAANTQFTFRNSMSKEVLRSYASRAVTHAGLCIENMDVDPAFEDDVRMLRRIGAKYIGRAAYYSWGGNMSAADIEKHYKIAKERADAVHQQDPEMILQAGVFEIAYQGTVNATKIPAYVFEAFGQPVENRNFRYEDVVYPRGTKDKNGTDTGIGCWGNAASGVPNIKSLETQMYFYYQITRYIDAGYEAFHMGQAEKMMLYEGNGKEGAKAWDRLLTLARTYAKKHARRGIALFDCHDALDSAGIKIGNRLVFDIQGAAIVPNETTKETVNGEEALMCEISDYKDSCTQWIGRTGGGEHPLGFTIEENFTILEFDNYGGNGIPGIATPQGFFNWGYDDVTWFATQPEWYRNRFLREADSYVKNHNLDTVGKQQYFIQFSCRRVITPEPQDYPKLKYTPEENTDLYAVYVYCGKENTEIDYNSAEDNYTLTVKKDYRANSRSDACPNGFNQEDTIRELFLGKNIPEDPFLLPSVPSGGNNSDPAIPPSSFQDNKLSSTKPNTQTPAQPNGSTVESSDVTASEVSSVDNEMSSDTEAAVSNPQNHSSDASAAGQKKSALLLILGVVFGGIVLLAAIVGCFYFFYCAH